MIRHPELLDRRAGELLDQLADRWRHWKQLTDDEAAFILERSAALQQYQEQLAERVRRLQATEHQESEAKLGSGSDLLLAVLSS